MLEKRKKPQIPKYSAREIVMISLQSYSKTYVKKFLPLLMLKEVIGYSVL